MHTRQSVVAGLVASLVKFQGHQEEQTLLTTTLGTLLGDKVDGIVEYRNFIDGITMNESDDLQTQAPPVGFPELTGNATLDAQAIAEWMGGPSDGIENEVEFTD